MKYYIIAGEASGDMHASNLMLKLKKLDSNAQFRCFGGDLMKAAGGHLVKHYRELAFMGFTEVIKNLRTILRNIELCKKDILQNKPDALILVDYPGFNLRIAEFAKENGIKVFYYISPQVWAWKQSRVHKIKRIVDRMFVILPFEKNFYKRFNYEVDFVGHPLLDAIEANWSNQSNKPVALIDQLTNQTINHTNNIITLLPGSRKQEISVMLPLMLSVIDKFPEYHFVIGSAPSIDIDFLKTIVKNKKVAIVSGQTYELLLHSKAALVTSGTATLETALFGVPEVVCYKGGWMSYSIARMLVKVDFISLVNLIMEKEVVKELIQNELNTENLTKELSNILNDQTKVGQIKRDYVELKNRLGGKGASAKTARFIYEDLSAKK